MINKDQKSVENEKVSVFISYGHDEYAVVAERLRDDLTKRGHDAWFDKIELRTGDNWLLKITKGIKKSSWVILLMTPHSMRIPNGVCLDETVFARSEGKNILPLMLKSVEVPFCIISLQYMFCEKIVCSPDEEADKQIEIDEKEYQEALNTIIEILNNKDERLRWGGLLSLLKDKLKPLENDIYRNRYNSDFVGRKWLFEKHEEWAKDEESKVFVLQGGPGTGKSEFVKALCFWGKEEKEIKKEKIGGIHFFEYSDSRKNNVRAMLKSLAYHLAVRVPEYAKELAQRKDLEEEQNPNALFNSLFIEPLDKIKNQINETVVLIIDALDEAGDEKQKIIDIIVEKFKETPKWLKLFVTARPEEEIKRRFEKFNPIVIDVEYAKENERDIEGYLKTQLEKDGIEHSNYDIMKLVEKSEGSFLYAVKIMKLIKTGKVSIKNIEDFPKDMKDMYLADFERIFEQKDEEQIKKLNLL